MRKLSLGQLSRNQLILGVCIVVLLIVNIFFAVGYFGAAGTKADLESDIATKQKYIDDNEARYNIGELQNELAEVQQELAEAPFLDDIDTLELIDHIIDVMKKAEIGTYTYSPGGIGTITIGGGTYRTHSYSISITSAEKLTTLIKLQSYIEDLPYDAVRTNNIKLSNVGGDSWKMTFIIQIITQWDEPPGFIGELSHDAIMTNNVELIVVGKDARKLTFVIITRWDQVSMFIAELPHDVPKNDKVGEKGGRLGKR